MDRRLSSIIIAALLCTGCADTPQESKDAWGPTLADYSLPYLTVCPLHQVPLNEAFEPVSAGRQHFTMDYYETARMEFPVAMRYLDDQSAQRGYVRYCPKCRDAEDAFHKRTIAAASKR